MNIAYEKETPLFDPAQSTQLFKQINIAKGKLDKGFAKAEIIVEGTYTTGAQEHVYIEPNGVIAVPAGHGISLYGSLQCPF